MKVFKPLCLIFRRNWINYSLGIWYKLVKTQPASLAHVGCVVDQLYSLVNSVYRLETIINKIGCVGTKLVFVIFCSPLKSIAWTSWWRFSPSKWTVILYAIGWELVLLSFHQKNIKKFRCILFTLNWWNIASISHINETSSCLNRHSKIVHRSVYWLSQDQRERFDSRINSCTWHCKRKGHGLWGLYTPWRGIYHTSPSLLASFWKCLMKMPKEEIQEKLIPDFLLDERKKVFFELPFCQKNQTLCHKFINKSFSLLFGKPGI